jgi:protein BUR2
VAKVAQKNSKLVIDEQSKEYWRWRDSILTYEEVMLEQLTFDLMVDNPYHHLFELLGRLEIVHNKHLRQAAWAFCNDAGLTAMPLLIEARDVAIAAIFFASVHTGQLIDDLDGEPWWRILKGDEERCAKAIEVMQQFYTENPLRKQNPSLPSPAFHLEQTRRRPDVLLSQGDTVSSNAGTPMEIDRASRSPGGRMNGGGDRESASQQSQTQGKRKETDMDVDVESARAEKRPRLPDEDEGEVIED